LALIWAGTALGWDSFGLGLGFVDLELAFCQVGFGFGLGWICLLPNWLFAGMAQAGLIGFGLEVSFGLSWLWFWAGLDLLFAELAFYWIGFC